MGKEKHIQRQRVLRRMMKIAAGPVNDAVKLAYLADGQVQEIEKLNLAPLTEFKRGGNGAVEMKFLDRVKVLERVIELLEEGQEEAAAQFLKAVGAAEGKDDL